MSEEPIRELLRGVDEAAGPAVFDEITTAHLRQRMHRRRLVRTTVSLSVAAVAVLATTVGLVAVRALKPQPEPQRIDSLEVQVRQLRAQTEATLHLVQEVLQRDRQERRLTALEAELASIPDPMREIGKQVDRTAFLLVYRADSLYKELNQRESAIKAYKEVIQLFPDNQWADVARQRLSQIEQRQINRSDPSGRQGEIQCERRSV